MKLPTTLHIIQDSKKTKMTPGYCCQVTVTQQHINAIQILAFIVKIMLTTVTNFIIHVLHVLTLFNLQTHFDTFAAEDLLSYFLFLPQCFQLSSVNIILPTRRHILIFQQQTAQAELGRNCSLFSKLLTLSLIQQFCSR